MQNFLLGFQSVGDLFLLLGGGLCAFLLAAAVVVLMLGILAMTFDRITARLAKRWQRTGKRPDGRIARIILAAHNDTEI